jgi:hypothetical protein
VANQIPNTIRFCALRAARLDTTTLAPVASATAGYTSHQQIECSISPQYDSQDEVVVKNGCGQIVMRLPAVMRLKGFDLGLQFAALEPALQDILVGAATIDDAGTPATLVGSSFPDQMGASAPDPPYAAIEGWAKAYINQNKPLPSPGPYVRWIFPAGQYRLDNSTLNNDAYTAAIAGSTEANDSWPADGAFGDQPFVVGRQGGWMWDTTIPSDSAGAYVTIS